MGDYTKQVEKEKGKEKVKVCPNVCRQGIKGIVEILFKINVKDSKTKKVTGVDAFICRKMPYWLITGVKRARVMLPTLATRKRTFLKKEFS